ncbi:MAG: penicillin-binding protein activator LpoB [Spirochaetes bacterium]|nr:penicillin-binding protein activator LpoB [Spirochaetota bacterium]
MFKKTIVVFALLAVFAGNAVFSQAPVALDTALSNAASQFAATVPHGGRLAVINIVSDTDALSNHVINQLIVSLVNTGAFTVVPRGEVEFLAAQAELDLQMTGFIGDDTQAMIGHAVGADSILTGTLHRETPTTFRLIIHVINVEGFAISAAYSGAIVDDHQMATLLGIQIVDLIPDYTTGERLGMAALNTIFGVGSITRGHHIGWTVTGLQVVGIAFFVAAQVLVPEEFDIDPWTGERNELNVGDRRRLNTAGFIALGAGTVVGWVIPFFHTRAGAGTPVASNPVPFNFELVSTNNQNINGVRIMHRITF